MELAQEPEHEPFEPAWGFDVSQMPSRARDGDNPEASDYAKRIIKLNNMHDPDKGGSAVPQQGCEDRQHTPPLPNLSTSAPSTYLSGFHARHKQLRMKLFDTGKADLFHTLTRSNDSTQPKTAVLNISALQNLAMYQLEFELACYVEYMYRTSEFCPELDGFTPLADLMTKYSESLKLALDSLIWYLTVARRRCPQS